MSKSLKRGSRRAAFRVVAVALVLLFVAAACGDDGESTSTPGTVAGGAPQTTAKPIKKMNFILGVRLPVQAHFTYVSGPAALGYWQDEGLNVSLQYTEGAAEQIAAMVSGDGDVTVAGSLTASVRPFLQGIVNLAFYNTIPGFFESPGVPEGSSIQSVADFKGKTIGVTSLESGTVAKLAIMAKEAGLGPNDYKVVAIGTGAQAAAALFVSKSVDAYAAPSEQYAVITNGDPAKYKFRFLTVKTAASWGAFGVPTFAFKGKLEADPDKFVGFARAIAKATVFASENPRAAVVIHNACFPESAPQGATPQEVIEKSMRVLDSRMQAMDIKRVDLPMTKWGEFVPTAVDQWFKDLVATSEPKFKAEDIHKLYTNKYIDQINAFDEAAVRAEARGFTDDKLPTYKARCLKV